MPPELVNTILRKIGTNRGRPRLWIEGAFLTEHGFAHGTRWEVHRVRNAGGLWLFCEAMADGPRRVAGTKERPIIDLNNAELLEGFGPQVQIIAIQPGLLAIGNATGGA